jgi:hypothetical protein
MIIEEERVIESLTDKTKTAKEFFEIWQEFIDKKKTEMNQRVKNHETKVISTPY